MPEQVADELHANASREQMHREAVSKAVGVTRYTELRHSHPLLEDIADCSAPQWSIGAARPQEELGMGPALSLALDREILA